jgi:hypothetical protein
MLAQLEMHLKLRRLKKCIAIIAEYKKKNIGKIIACVRKYRFLISNIGTVINTYLDRASL